MPRGHLIRPSGAFGILSTGAFAVTGEGGVCPECCGEQPDPSGPCSCSQLVYADRTCGIPRDTTWTVRVAGSVTYANSEVRTLSGNATVISSIAAQTRTFDVTRTFAARACGGDVIIPTVPETAATFTDTAPGATNATLRLGYSITSNSSPFGGWAAGSTGQWAQTGTASYTPSANNLSMVSGAFGGVDGLNIAGFLNSAIDRIYASHEVAGDAKYAGLNLQGASSASVQSNFPVGYTSSEAGTLTLTRNACAYQARRVVAASFSGANISGSLRTDRSSSFSADYTITAQLLRCGSSGGALRGGPGREDPRVIEAAERLLRGCRGCGER